MIDLKMTGVLHKMVERKRRRDAERGYLDQELWRQGGRLWDGQEKLVYVLLNLYMKAGSVGIHRGKHLLK